MKNNPIAPHPPEESSSPSTSEGVLLVDKPTRKTSFSLVSASRKKTGIEKIGHAGTLDPFATGLMVMLIGKDYTRLSDTFLCARKRIRDNPHPRHHHRFLRLRRTDNLQIQCHPLTR